MSRASNTKARQSQIVRALSVVMAEQGYDGATIHTIAAEAGLTPGLVHYHFKSKLEIFLSLIAVLDEAVRQRYVGQKKPNDTPIQDLKAFVDAFLALGKDSDETAVRCWIIIGAEALRQSEVSAAYRAATAKHIAILETIIKRCLAQDRRSQQNCRAVSLGIHAAIEGSLRLLVSAPSKIQVGSAAPTVFAMAKGAIANQPRA
jgi:TetR/AcrR family transcriptional repressor of bet genes